MMQHRGVAGIGPAPRAAETVELRLLLPADHVRALEAAAGRSEQTVGALIRRAVGNFLQSSAAAGFVGEAAELPTASRVPSAEGH